MKNENCKKNEINEKFLLKNFFLKNCLKLVFQKKQAYNSFFLVFLCHQSKSEMFCRLKNLGCIFLGKLSFIVVPESSQTLERVQKMEKKIIFFLKTTKKTMLIGWNAKLLFSGLSSKLPITQQNFLKILKNQKKGKNR